MLRPAHPKEPTVIIHNQTQQNLGRLIIFLMAVLIARGGVSAEQIGRPSAPQANPCLSGTCHGKSMDH